MSIAGPLTALKAELLQTVVPQILDLLTRALQEGTAVHQVESQLWDLTRQVGHRSGAFDLERTAYGSREGQALEFVPLDNRLQLPRGAFSYLLQDWDQARAAEQAFGQVNQTIERMLKLKQSVDSLVGWIRMPAA